jgi:hypothetical protein
MLPPFPPVNPATINHQACRLPAATFEFSMAALEKLLVVAPANFKF